MKTKRSIIEVIRATRVIDLGLPDQVVIALVREWLLKIHFKEEVVKTFGDFDRLFADYRSKVTVGQIIDEYGDLPRHTGVRKQIHFVPPSQAFKKFFTKLYEMGMTPVDWPPLAMNLQDVFESYIVRMGNNKQKLRHSPLVVLGMSSHLLEAVGLVLSEGKYFKKPSVKQDWTRFTTADLLGISPSKILSWTDSNIIHSLKVTREKLRSLGFTNDDGPFLSAGNRVSIIEKISTDLSVSLGKAEEILNYFHWPGHKIID